jgi:aminoglycoside phosphotransferase (APT) family kinase protein
MIPESKKKAVVHALQSTFGVNEFNEIQELTAGLSSALVLKIIIGTRPYLLRIITRTDAMADPTHEYTCMKAAAEAGIAPKVWYANVDERISIIDFVEAKPFPVTEAKVKMPDLLKRLHSLPPFPFRINYLDKMDGFVARFKEAKIIGGELATEIFDAYARIKQVYPRDSHDWVACHNDLKPENTLFDGERVWLVDWEAAFLNDPYLDLAISANFLVGDTADERDYLEVYFGKEADDYQHARFFLMRQLLHLFYAVVFIQLGKTPDKPVDFNIPIPGFIEYHDLIWAGNISLANADNKLLYAQVHMEQLRHNLRLKRFEESLLIVSNGAEG